MNFANGITAFRIVLAPVFLVVFLLVEGDKGNAVWLWILWAIFLVSEVSDVLDGVAARSWGLQSDLGKLLDPFADVISRLTIFLCLLLAGVAPLYAFVAVLYREISMTFLRLLFIQRGRVQAASMGGKLKAWLYFLASLAGLLLYTLKVSAGTWGEGSSVYVGLWWIVQVFFAVSVLVSLVSFAHYLSGYFRLAREK